MERAASPAAATAFRGRLLASFGVGPAEERAFLSPTRQDLLAAMPPGGKACVARLAAAAAGGERIALFGDTDIDGCLGVAILEDVLTRLGAKVSSAFDETTRHEGPGLRLEPLEEALAAGCRLVVTVDCSVRDPEVAAELACRGVEVWVTDHHPPPAGSVERHVNPLLPDAPFAHLCGAGVTLTLALALEPGGLESPEAGDAIAAAFLATLGDSVPLVGPNRAICLLGLEAWEASERPVFVSLRRPPKAGLGAQVLALRRQAVAPLNSAPRYGDAKATVDAFTCRDEAAAAKVVARVQGANRRRRQEMSAILKGLGSPEPPRDGEVGVYFPQGVKATHVSLVAGHLVRSFNRPVIVFGEAPGGHLRGSARSPDGRPLRDLAAEALGSLAVDLGGHSLAFGVTIQEADGKDAAARLAKVRVAAAAPTTDAIPAAGLSPEAALAEVEALGPYGPGFPRPFLSFAVAAVEGRGGDAALLKVAGGDLLATCPGGFPAQVATVAGRLASSGGHPMLKVRAVW